MLQVSGDGLRPGASRSSWSGFATRPRRRRRRRRRGGDQKSHPEECASAGECWGGVWKVQGCAWGGTHWSWSAGSLEEEEERKRKEEEGATDLCTCTAAPGPTTTAIRLTKTLTTTPSPIGLAERRWGGGLKGVGWLSPAGVSRQQASRSGTAGWHAPIRTTTYG